MAKQARDENKPKKAQSTWMAYCSAERKKVAKPGMSVGDVAKELSVLWAAMNETQRLPYVTLANQDKERYIKAMESYVPCVVEKVVEAVNDVVPEEGVAVTKTKKTKRVVDPNRKPRPASGYQLYCSGDSAARQAIKTANPTTKPSDLMKLLGESWKGLTDEERGAWNEKAKV